MNKTKQQKCLKLVYNLLLAQRNGNVMREQCEYDKLKSFCDHTNIDMEQAIVQGKAWLASHSIAAIMNGIV